MPQAPMSQAPMFQAAALPYLLPPCANARVALCAVRRMGAHGLADAPAAHALFTTLGGAFRRPLTLMRALMADVRPRRAAPLPSRHAAAAG